MFDNCEHVVDAARSLVARDPRRMREGSRAGDEPRSTRAARRARHLAVVAPRRRQRSDCSAPERARLAPTSSSMTGDAHRDRRDLYPPRRHPARRSSSPRRVAGRCRRPRSRRRLDDRFRTAPRRPGRVERHRTLQAAVEWSYSLLDDDERGSFDRMAVFAGGALIDAIAAVVELDEYDALDILDRLVAHVRWSSASTRSSGPATANSKPFASTPTTASSNTAPRTRQRDRHLAWATRWRRSFASPVSRSGGAARLSTVHRRDRQFPRRGP